MKSIRITYIFHPEYSGICLMSKGTGYDPPQNVSHIKLIDYYNQNKTLMDFMLGPLKDDVSTFWHKYSDKELERFKNANKCQDIGIDINHKLHPIFEYPTTIPKVNS